MKFGSIGVGGSAHPGDGLCEVGLGSCKVEADMSRPAGAEDMAGAQSHPRLVKEHPGRPGKVGNGGEAFGAS